MRLIFLKESRFECRNLFSCLVEPFCFLFYVGFEFGNKPVAAVLGGAHNDIGALVRLVDNPRACLLGIDKRGADRLLLALHCVKLSLCQAELFFKLVVFPVKLGIFFDNEIDMFVNLDGTVAS